MAHQGVSKQDYRLTAAHDGMTSTALALHSNMIRRCRQQPAVEGCRRCGCAVFLVL